MTSAQLADATARKRAGRPDITVMTNRQRRDAGLMDRRQAIAHERLAILPYTRPAERFRGRDLDDPWALPAPEGD